MRDFRNAQTMHYDDPVLAKVIAELEKYTPRCSVAEVAEARKKGGVSDE